MERDEIIRRDFPSSRRGYDREAVDSHLLLLADRIAALELEVAEAARAAGERAAEEAAMQVELDAIADRGEVEVIVDAVQEAVSGLVRQANELRSRVDSIGRGLIPLPNLPGIGGRPETSAEAIEAITVPIEGEPDVPRDESEQQDQTGAARLIALELALGGSDRAEVEAAIEREYKVDGLDSLLDDVFARVSSR